MLFNGKYYNKPGHLGMTRAELKEALAGGGGGGITGKIKITSTNITTCNVPAESFFVMDQTYFYIPQEFVLENGVTTEIDAVLIIQPAPNNIEIDPEDFTNSTPVVSSYFNYNYDVGIYVTAINDKIIEVNPTNYYLFFDGFQIDLIYPQGDI